MILTVTPNAAVDRTYRIDGFALDRVNRPTIAHTVAGGKGINVARVYQTLAGRGTAIATGFLGGNNGRIVAEALEREDIPNACVPVVNETRLCIAIIDRLTGTQTEINERGPAIISGEIELLLARIDSLLTQNHFDFVVLCGSLPPDAPPHLYADIIRRAKRMGVRTVLDSSGEALRQGVAAGPWMVKPNRTELRDLVGESLSNQRWDRESEIGFEIKAAEWLQSEYNIPMVLVTLGERGAILLSERERWRAVPPPIEFASAVASGDSFLAAFLWAWCLDDKRLDSSVYKREEEYTREETLSTTELATQAVADWLRPMSPAGALRLATGAGAANAAVIGAGFCTRESIFQLATRAELSDLKF